MRIESWNLNGVLSKVKAGAFEPLKAQKPDVLCFQEVRTKQHPNVLASYHHIWNSALRDGFWGTLTLTKTRPLNVLYGVGVEAIDQEGRVIACEFKKCWVVNVYVPNAQSGFKREAVRREWDQAFLTLAEELSWQKPTIICGDFNVALSDDDIYEGNPHRGQDDEDGFLSDERSGLTHLLDLGFVDAFRLMHPQEKESYTWWSQRKNRRSVNHGWRLDYFFVSKDAKNAIIACNHLTNIKGSDHCPIELEVAL